jgi:hypothetical protein
MAEILGMLLDSRMIQVLILAASATHAYVSVRDMRDFALYFFSNTRMLMLLASSSSPGLPSLKK